MLRKILLVLLFILLSPICLYATETEKIELSLKDVIEMSLKSNPDISIERVNPLIRENTVIENDAAFDPKLLFEFNVKKDVTPSASSLASPEVGVTESASWDLGISQKIVTGGDYEFKFSNTKTKTNSSFSGLNPQYVPGISLSFKQPLLKDFGIELNKGDLRIAKNNKTLSTYALKWKIIDVISTAEKLYWELVFSLEDLKLKQESLKLAKDLEERIKIQVEIGTIPSIEILNAQAEVASREEAVIVAENNLLKAEDDLKDALNIAESGRAPSILPKDPPLFIEEKISLDESIKTALKNRYDMQEAKLELENIHVDISTKKNAIYPNVDLVGGIGFSALSGIAGTKTSLTTGAVSPTSNFGGSYFKGVERMFSGEYYEWNIGVSVGIPIGNRSAKSSYASSKLTAGKKDMEIKRLEQKIALEVREDVRNMETDIKRVQATEVSKKLAAHKLKSEEKRLEVGMSTAFNVMQFQRDLFEEGVKHLKALIDYKKSIIELYKSTGITLDKNNISFE